MAAEKIPEPLFTKFISGETAYDLVRHGRKTFVADYAEEPGQMDSLALNPYPSGSFLPCSFCNAKDNKITFRYANFQGTNTSGGTETKFFEIFCAHCKIYSVYCAEDVTYPYD